MAEKELDVGLTISEEVSHFSTIDGSWGGTVGGGAMLFTVFNQCHDAIAIRCCFVFRAVLFCFSIVFFFLRIVTLVHISKPTTSG